MAATDSSLRFTILQPTSQFVGSFNFEVLINWDSSIFSPTSGDDVTQSFTRVSGIVSQSEQMEFMQGTDPYVRKAPGRASFENITLERVYNGVDAFYEWRSYVQQGNDAPLTVDIYMKRRDGSDVRHIQCVGAWPSRWEMPDMDASSSGAAIERITLSVLEVVEMKVDTDSTTTTTE